MFTDQESIKPLKRKSISRDLYVADISFDAEEEDLRKLFSVCGTVSSIHLITDQQSGLFKGCAFVRMASPAEARDVLNSLDGTRLLDRCISITAARPKKTAASKVASPSPEKLRRPRPRRKRQ